MERHADALLTALHGGRTLWCLQCHRLVVFNHETTLRRRHQFIRLHLNDGVCARSALIGSLYLILPVREFLFGEGPDSEVHTHGLRLWSTRQLSLKHKEGKPGGKLNRSAEGISKSFWPRYRHPDSLMRVQHETESELWYCSIQP